jgi:5-methyltetrahydrofolate--homocysteine methyltransferase
MLIIGEKINGTLKKVGEAVMARDAAFIQDLALRQVQAGADYVDVNAGTPATREPDDLVWLVETVQAVTDTPLCLDSANPQALAAALERTQRPPLINSISGEESRLTGILPLIPRQTAGVIAVLIDDAGIPKDVESRLRVAHKVMEHTRAAGVPDDQVYIDPLVLAVATQQDSALVALETMRRLRAEYPSVRFSVGLSNISFGLPMRSLVNRAFLTLALYVGLDAAIMDPLDRGVIETLLATKVVLGRDRFCRQYTKAFREGRLGRA